MRWLREKAKSLSMLTLFALAFQLGLSFGHAHFDRAFAGIATISGQASQSAPDNNRDHHGNQDLCAICISVSIANTLIDSMPPVLSLPVAITASKAIDIETVDSTSTPTLGFQSRGPPRS